MRIITNHKLITRNAKIGRYTSIGALIVLGVGMYITFTRPEMYAYSLGALVLGFFLSQMGMYFGNRWSRSPRPDEVLDKGLKGLGREYTIYHYVTPASHLLVGPSGLWVLLPLYQGGNISYEKKRWRQRGAGFIQNYLKLFGQDNIGRPELEAASDIESLKRYFHRVQPDLEIPEINSAAIFVHPTVELNAERAPIPAMVPKDFKEFLKTGTSAKILSSSQLSALREALPKAEREEQSD
jgi:hypothetical protein